MHGVHRQLCALLNVGWSSVYTGAVQLLAAVESTSTALVAKHQRAFVLPFAVDGLVVYALCAVPFQC